MASNGSLADGMSSPAAAPGLVTRSGVLPKIQTHNSTVDKKKPENGICHDDSAPPVKARTIDELHSLQQKRRSAPVTPMKDAAAGAFSAPALTEEERHQLQLQSISASLASLTRETGPNVVKGDPAKKQETPKATHQPHHYFTPTISVSDSSLKFTHVLYNLSPAELYEQAIKYEKGSFVILAVRGGQNSIRTSG